MQEAMLHGSQPASCGMRDELNIDQKANCFMLHCHGSTTVMRIVDNIKIKMQSVLDNKRL